ncbi:hypothetical protein vBRpoPV17_79 [Ruegeria phage vB_RpoP-V17]|uniref:Uncharacterized protein n=3 Tax=Aorunvirus V12 TaxID=2846074 RepID=A0A2Z4QG00_9CAUD|nr:hypothetical protein HYP62_gp81 [Ruegeria phage vB_RpoP-V12]AWY08868.1 hypothetical protein vBRpoPV12_81 [Ruegeria phage vB_RpoP-V12]AWY09037.1 hypothetical protein vBRpoPV21_78 [Ruegeria phage vB_RpoP-V21]AWY09598.1 hypothetical protein vBRpoPV17_79 [Ruegeria phage vB_RpoP-V17]
MGEEATVLIGISIEYGTRRGSYAQSGEPITDPGKCEMELDAKRMLGIGLSFLTGNACLVD